MPHVSADNAAQTCLCRRQADPLPGHRNPRPNRLKAPSQRTPSARLARLCMPTRDRSSPIAPEKATLRTLTTPARLGEIP